MPFLDVSAEKLYYEVHGAGPRTVICSHGFSLDHDMWAPQVAALSGEFRVIVWDERGHGLSTANGAFTFWDSAADLIAILDDVGAERAVIVGMSQGGWVSVRAALRYPERVEGIVMVDSVIQAFAPEEIEGHRQMSEAWLTSGPVGEIAAGMAGVQFGPDFDATVWLAKWRARSPASWQEPWAAIVREFTSEALDGRVGEIACPAAIIHGSEDQAFALAKAQEMAGWFPNFTKLTVIDGGAHCPTLTHPEQVNAALREFLGGI
jgi:pimeloyl-ACP methyl ester carboxylesterase